MRKSILIPFSLFFYLLFLFSSCGISRGHYLKLHNSLVLRDYVRADDIILKGKNNYGKRNSLLFYLDRAIVLHLAGRYQESNQLLRRAEKRVDELYTIRLSKEAGGLILNDNVLPYAGEDFERVLINLFSALNYVFLQEWDEALVECRKVDKKLSLYNSKYEKKNVYKEDAFIRYLSALLFEAQDELNDAFIDYRKSFEIYQSYAENYNTPPLPFLTQDLLRTTFLLGFKEEYEEYRQKFSPRNKNIDYAAEQKNKGELIFILYNGEVPRKESYAVYIPIENYQIIKLAFPKFVSPDLRVDHARVKALKTNYETRTYLGEDIAAIAIKNLKNRIARISAKTIARATAKAIASRGAGKLATDDALGQKLVTFLTQTVANIIEEADLRSWRTLPAQIQIARLLLKPGKYDFRISFRNKWGAELESTIFRGVKLKAGKKKIIKYRIY